MTYNGAKTTQTLAVTLLVNSFPAISCEESPCREMAYNGSKRRLEAMPGYGTRAGQLAKSRDTEEATPDTTAVDSRNSEASSQRNDASSLHNDPVLGETELLALAAPARQKARIAPDLMREIIRNLCRNRFLTFLQIGSLVNRHPEGIRNRILSVMVQSGELIPRFPDNPTHPEQAYQTSPDWREP